MKAKTTNKKKLRRLANAQKRQAGIFTDNAPVRFSMMAKPIGPACNLAANTASISKRRPCSPAGADRRMSHEVLEAYTRKYIESQPGAEVAFHWQGGEPMLMGLDFFRQAVELQRRYAGRKTVRNVIQTNGTLIDDQWCQFLREGDWLVGLSLDGPSDIHDAYRLDAAGNGSFAAVKRGLDVLLKYAVEFNILASVTPASTADPLRVYRFLKDAGARFVQFMPIVERLPDETATQLGLQLAVGVRSGEGVQTVRMTPWSVQGEAYGEFLCRVFDYWVRHDVGAFTVMNFEWAFANYLGLPPRVCQFMAVCGRSPIIEHNGDVYACDHYVYPQYRLGNILTDDLQEMVQSQKQCEFGMAKCEALPEYCQDCPVLPACRGECPKRRFMAAPNGQAGLNYLCAGYKRFFEHAGPYFEAMRRLKQAGQPVTTIMNTEIHVMPRPPGSYEPTAMSPASSFGLAVERMQATGYEKAQSQCSRDGDVYLRHVLSNCIGCSGGIGYEECRGTKGASESQAKNCRYSWAAQ